MGTCKECRYFDTEGSKRDGFGRCARWLVGYSVTDDEMALNDVLVEDDEGWGMVVGPDFGCVLFEAPAP